MNGANKSATSEQRGRNRQARRGAVAMCHGPRVGNPSWSYGQGPGPGVKLKKPETVPLKVDDVVFTPVVLTTTTKSD